MIAIFKHVLLLTIENIWLIKNSLSLLAQRLVRLLASWQSANEVIWGISPILTVILLYQVYVVGQRFKDGDILRWVKIINL